MGSYEGLLDLLLIRSICDEDMAMERLFIEDDLQRNPGSLASLLAGPYCVHRRGKRDFIPKAVVDDRLEEGKRSTAHAVLKSFQQPVARAGVCQEETLQDRQLPLREGFDSGALQLDTTSFGRPA